jgi:hypothetical protein
MDRTQHHERAEQLLSDAGEEPDSFRRGQILAEAQVHATLALTAAPGTSPPGPGQPETSSTASTMEEPSGSTWRSVAAGIGLLPTAPGRQPGYTTPRTPAGAAPPRKYPARRPGDPVGEPAAPAPPAQPPSAAYPPRSRKRRPTEQPREQQPDGPEKPEPGSFTPFTPS